MRLPQTPTPYQGHTPVAPHATVYSSFEDVDFEIGCECANPALQIEAWTEEASPEAPLTSY